MTSCSVYYWGVGQGEEGLQLRNVLGIGFLVVSNYIVHYLLHVLFYYYYCCYFFSPCVILLNCRYINPQVFCLFSSKSPPYPTAGAGNDEWVSSHVVLSCWLGPNHDTPLPNLLLLVIDRDMLKSRNVREKQQGCVSNDAFSYRSSYGFWIRHGFCHVKCLWGQGDPGLVLPWKCYD